jgi:hypothetical protein
VPNKEALCKRRSGAKRLKKGGWELGGKPLFFHQQNTACGIDVYLYKGRTANGRFLSAVRSKFVFLLPQKHPGCLSAPGKLAFCARWLQKGKMEERGRR